MPASDSQTIFISRAGEDAEIAASIGRILQGAGYTVILQQWNFTHQNFIAAMDDALRRGARVIALLSHAYDQSDYCKAEWTTALYGDPLNKMRRLIVLRVADFSPGGMLAAFSYTDLLPLLADSQGLAETVLAAIGPTRRGALPETPERSLDPEMPQPVANFTGRGDEMAALENFLCHGDGRAVVVHGFGGTGKSTLARAYARQHADRYGIVAWLAAETENGIIDGLLRLGSLIDPRIPTIADRRAAALRVTEMDVAGSGKPVLLIFDNLDDERLLRRWSPRQGAHVIATSRKARWGKDVSEIPLDIWPIRDAVRYLRDESGRDDLIDADAQSLADALGNLPLALSQAAAYLKATWTVSARDYLERIAHYLANPPPGAEDRHAVFATFQAALAKAEEQARGAAAIACLAAFFAPDAIPEELFRQNVDVYPPNLRPQVPGVVTALDLRSTIADPICFQEALGALDRLSLISFGIESRVFNVHRLVQAAARDLTRDDDRWQPAAVAVMDEAFPPAMYENWAMCERHLAHALSVLAGLADDAFFSSASGLASECGEYLRERAAYAQAESLLLRAVHIDEKLYGPKHRSVAVDLTYVGRLQRELRQFGVAEQTFSRAVAIFEETAGTEHLDTAVSLMELGAVLHETGNLTEAERLLRRTLEICERSLGPDTAAVATVLGEIAVVLSRKKNFSEAEQLMRRALAIDEKRCGPEHPDIAHDLADIARVLAVQDRFDEAEPLFRRALAIREKSLGPEHPATGWTLTDLGRLLQRTGRADEAEHVFRRALDIDERMLGAHNPSVPINLRDLASLLLEIGKADDAAPLLERADEIDEANASQSVESEEPT